MINMQWGSLKFVDTSVEAILQISRYGIHAKVKWMGYNSSQNQWIQLSELQDTVSEVLKNFLRGKE